MSINYGGPLVYRNRYQPQYNSITPLSLYALRNDELGTTPKLFLLVAHWHPVMISRILYYSSNKNVCLPRSPGLTTRLSSQYGLSLFLSFFLRRKMCMFLHTRFLVRQRMNRH